jgi:uncharacterized protein (DUF58 family)
MLRLFKPRQTRLKGSKNTADRGRIIDYDFFNRLEAIRVYMEPSMEGYFGGRHRVKRYGSTVEFADFREYTLGDDIRHIDWNLYSRFEKHYIKLFVDERQMSVQVFLDCSASMRYGKSADKGTGADKSVYAMRAAAGIGFLSVRSTDKTSFRLIYGGFADDLCGTIMGKETFLKAMSDFEKIDFRGEADIAKAVTTCRNLGSNDGLTVIISDFMTENNWKDAVDYLLYRNRQVLVIQVLSPEERDPAYKGRIWLMDSEADGITDDRNVRIKVSGNRYRAYKQALNDYVADMEDFCVKRGVYFISADTGEPIEKLFIEKLLKTGVIR